MIIKINSEKIIQFFPKEPLLDLILYGWEWTPRDYFFGFIPTIIYIKKLIK